MNGVEMIAAERQRQVAVEGWTPEHDDEHLVGEMAAAAMCYAERVIDRDITDLNDVPFAQLWWPWEPEHWKPCADPIRNLVKAGALIAAEIDRLQRQQEKGRQG